MLKPNKNSYSSQSDSSRISTSSMEEIIENLKYQQHRDSTKRTYLTVWRLFNKYIMKLDKIPNDWEDHTALFVAFLIEEKKMQSALVKSYISAIKTTLKLDNYPWNENQVLFTSLTKACKVKNDKLLSRLPIHCGLLEMILFEIKRTFDNQPFLQTMYMALFVLGYYGLFRAGEITKSPHIIRARNIFLGWNKDKMLIILYSSKTHTEGS